jgi:hypothetical protein
MDYETRMQIYPLLLASVVIDAGGEIEISEKAFREACEIARQNRSKPSPASKMGSGMMDLKIVGDVLKIKVE